MKYIILTFTTTTLLLLNGCMSFDPVPDKDKPVVLSLPLSDDVDTKSEIPPVQLVGFPSYLNRPVPVYMGDDSTLQRIDGYYWAEPLSSSVADELSIALISLKKIPEGASIRVRFYRFLLLQDGSAESILEWSLVSKEREVIRGSLETIRNTDQWDPQNPVTFIQGYTKLLAASAQAIRNGIEQGNGEK